MRQNYLPEIDLARGIAVMMMVINHAGLALLSKAALATPIGHFWIQFGSFAPVVFFLTTGIGAGVQYAQGHRASNVGLRAMILFAADAILTVYARGAIGFDFLAFIGLSTLVCAMLSRTPHGVAIGVIAFLLIASLRFIAGPLLRGVWIFDDMPVANMLIGVYAVPGISYTLSPWLCFPLLGFCAGWIAIRLAEGDPFQLRWFYLSLLVMGMVLMCAGLYAVSQNAVFVRYGTVSASFFVTAIGASLLTVGLCGMVENVSATLPRIWLDWLRTRGVACLAIVPIHYLLIALLKRGGVDGLRVLEFLFLMAIAVPLCVYLGQLFEKASQFYVIVCPASVIYVTTVLIAVISLFLCYKIHTGMARVWLPFLGQLALCVLLVATSRRATVCQNGPSLLKAEVSSSSV
jgi:uncharacterized membrane protein